MHRTTLNNANPSNPSNPSNPTYNNTHNDDEHNIPTKPPVLRRQHATYGLDNPTRNKKRAQLCEHCSHCSHPIHHTKASVSDFVSGSGLGSAADTAAGTDTGSSTVAGAGSSTVADTGSSSVAGTGSSSGGSALEITGGKSSSGSKGPRRVPEHHPSAHKVGTRKRGLDGRMYEVKLNSINVQRWMPCSKK